MDASPVVFRKLTTKHSLKKNNDLCRDATTFTFEMALGFFCPIVDESHPLPGDVYKATVNSLAKQKLTKIPHNKSFTDFCINTGDMVEVSVYDGKRLASGRNCAQFLRLAHR